MNDAQIIEAIKKCSAGEFAPSEALSHPYAL